MASGIAYVSQGKLHLWDGNGRKKTIESKFAQQVRDRTIELHKKNAWKAKRVLMIVYDAEAANREDLLNKTSAPGLVSQNWQLVKQKLDANPEVLARGVMSFDLASDGSIVYSNGSEVYTLAPGSKPERVIREDFIERVATAS